MPNITTSMLHAEAILMANKNQRRDRVNSFSFTEARRSLFCLRYFGFNFIVSNRLTALCSLAARTVHDDIMRTLY